MAAVFPPLNLEVWNLAVLAPSPVIAGVGNEVQAFAINGTVTFGVGRWQNTSGNPYPTNVTMQFTLYGDFNGSMTLRKQLIGSPVFGGCRREARVPRYSYRELDLHSEFDYL